MSHDELNQIVRGGESVTVEFKKSTGEQDAALKTTCAMLNGRGGFILFGVLDKGTVAGQQIGAHTLENLVGQFRNLEPPAFPDVETVEVAAGLFVIALRVPGGGGPYTYDARPYLRNSRTTTAMPQGVYEQKLLERSHPLRRWELQPAEGITFADLDASEVTRTVDEAIRRGRLDEPGTRKLEPLLTGLGLIREGQLLNAAVPLFAKPERLPLQYPQCLLKLARFRGLDKSEFIDNRQEYGHAFDLLTRAQRFLRDHLPVAGRILPSVFEREDDPLYPPAALREALANAICHRDYGCGGGSISVAIYADRLEIGSVGILPFGQTPDELTRPHPSRPWNPVIAGVFHRRGVIESWGRGTLKMAELTRQAGLPASEIVADGGEVIVRFRPTGYLPPDEVKRDLSPLQKQLLTILSDHGPCALSVIVENLPADTSRRTVQDNLKLLYELGQADVSGKGRWARWRLKGTPERRA